MSELVKLGTQDLLGKGFTKQILKDENLPGFGLLVATFSAYRSGILEWLADQVRESPFGGTFRETVVPVLSHALVSYPLIITLAYVFWWVGDKWDDFLFKVKKGGENSFEWPQLV